jgi:uncharacterized protein (DUF885 family)
MPRTLVRAALVGWMIASPSRAQPAAPAPPLALAPTPAPEFDPTLAPMRSLVERFSADQSSLERFDGTPMSPARAARMREFYDQWLATLGSIDFGRRDHDGQVDYLLLKNHLRREREQLDHQRRRDEEVRPLLPFWEGIVELEQQRKAMTWAEGEKSAERLTALAKRIADARKAVEQPREPTSRVVANRAAARVDELRQALDRWYKFYAGYDPVFTWWAAEPYKQADGELTKYAEAVRQKLVKRKDEDEVLGDPIGREALVSELAHEMIPYTPEELIGIANKEFAWCDVEMKRAARDLGFGDDWHKALEHVKGLHVKPGEQPELIRKLALEAIEFLDQRDLVTIPKLCRDTWRIEMMTPQRQRFNPFFTGGEVISVSFPTAEMAHEDKLMSLRGNNIHFSRATVHHELIPGHHLQTFMAQRYRSHRREFRTPFLVEGWALYWEMVLWDMGFPKTPEDRVGFLFWRSHRCARIIFSLKFHLGQMTAAEAIDFLVDRVGHERRNAAAEVRRSFESTYEPLYQAAYMVGGLQLRALRRELVDSKKMTDKQFHDAVLKENSIPIEMIRAALTNQPLTKDFKSAWRFYD